ncbi:acyltransferase [Paenibacillus sp. N3/727]|uniref:acyltransferase n=1 Tax=Paenibacillus sp. N3/727 TaxID=2925845 RepID=UPI001F5353B5|nr:acyltransferase [Paenibacillus sp. N3/727]UNK21210.1 acyltransferase [Paenibacillus sp. N3/727]
MNKSDLQKKRENIPELQLVRAFAILGVLSVHSTSYASTAMTGSNYFFLYNFMNIFMKYGTPTFIFLSSFVLFYNYYERPLTKELIGGFFKKRMLFIIIPYIVFSALYFGLLHMLHYQDRSLQDTVESFIGKLLTGKAYTHLYFVFISIQFYVLFPIILWLFKKAPLLTRWAIPIGLAVQWTFVLLNKYYWQVPNKGSWSLSYMAYFMLGACIGIYYPKLKGWLTLSLDKATWSRMIGWIVLWTCWAAAGLTHVYLYYNYRLYGAMYNSTLYELMWNLHTYLGALTLLQLAFVVYRKAPRGLTSTLERLGALSFGIYLIHPFFLLLYRQYPPLSGSPIISHIWYAGGFIFALCCSWIVVALTVRYVPFSWILFGNISKTKRSHTRREKSLITIENSN